MCLHSIISGIVHLSCRSGAHKGAALMSWSVFSQAFANEQSAMLADLPSREDGNFTQTQAGQAPSAALEAMETDEGEGPAFSLPQPAPASRPAPCITHHKAAHSSLHMLTCAATDLFWAIAWHACQIGNDGIINMSCMCLTLRPIGCPS